MRLSRFSAVKLMLAGLRTRRSVLLAALLALTSAVCFAQVPTDSLLQLAEVGASDGAAGEYFGTSIAISGKTVVVGANNADSNMGAAYVFVQPASGWANMVQTAKLTASDGKLGDGLGDSVSIYGNTIVVGAPGHHTRNRLQGAAYVFVKPSTGWQNMTETAKLTASDGTSGDLFALNLAISGNTVLVGARNDPSNGTTAGPGAAYLFVEPATGWTDTTETAKLTATDAVAGSGFGFSVALDANAAVVGAAFATVGENQGQGATYVFMKPLAGWQTTSRFNFEVTAVSGAANSYFGAATSISGDTIAIGSYAANAFEGSAYVFGR